MYVFMDVSVFVDRSGTFDAHDLVKMSEFCVAWTVYMYACVYVYVHVCIHTYMCVCG